MSFRITISPSRRAAARFVTAVRRALQKAYVEEQDRSGLTQTAIASALNVHRSVINRELRGRKDLTLGRVAELAWAMGRYPHFELLQLSYAVGFAMFSLGLRLTPTVNQVGVMNMGGIATGTGFTTNAAAMGTLSMGAGFTTSNAAVTPGMAVFPGMQMAGMQMAFPTRPLQTAQTVAA
jgi:plasmid maintenance system antidote protein VapI